MPSIAIPSLRARVRRLHVAGRRDSVRGRTMVGLDIGTVQLTAAVLEDDGATVTKLVSGPLGTGIVSGGEVRDPAALGAALDDFFSQHELPRQNVRIGVANSRIGVREVEVAGIESDEQLQNVVSFRAHDILPIPPDEAVIDYQVLEESLDEAGQRVRRILLIVAYRDSVERYLTAANQAGIELIGIDLEAFALLRSLRRATAEGAQPSATVVVSIGHERTTLAISDGTACCFTRVLDWGGSVLTNSVSRALKIPLAEAAVLKQRVSLTAPLDGSAELPNVSQARDAMRHEVTTITRELISSLRFYQTQPRSLPIATIVLAGGGSSVGGLPEELERELGIPVEIGDGTATSMLGKGVEPPRNPAAVAVAIGLGREA